MSIVIILLKSAHSAPSSVLNLNGARKESLQHCGTVLLPKSGLMLTFLTMGSAHSSATEHAYCLRLRLAMPAFHKW